MALMACFVIPAARCTCVSERKTMQKPNSRSGVRRILWILAAVAMIVAVMPLAGATAATETEPMVVDLIVDGGTDSTTWVNIGGVQVWDDGITLTVTYVVDEAGWCLTSTAVDIQTDALEDGDFARTKKGAPKVGKFAFKADHDPCVTTHTETIDLSALDGDVTAIAAHADTLQAGGLDALELALPDQVSMNVTHPGGDSYFNVTVSGGTVLDGTYDDYCIDVGHTISPGITYTADVYSSYEDLSGIANIDKPENMPYVNWIINQNYVGTLSPGGFGTYTYGDVQRAIWTIIDNSNSTAGLGPWNADRVAEIVDAAWASGEGYEPGCGDVVAVILVPVNGQQITVGQITFAEVNVPCEDREETAWAGVWNENGDGTGVFGHKFVDDAAWAGYFMYTVDPG